MARRRLESAINAGRVIEKGSDLPFERLSVAATYAVPDEHHGVYSLQHSMDGSILAIGHGDGSLAFVSTVTGKLEHETRRNRLGPFAVMCIRFSPKEQHICLVGTSVGRVYAASILDAHVDELLSEHSNEINCLDFCLDGSQFATAGKDLNIRLYDTNTAKVVRKYEGYSMVSEDDSSGHAQRVFSLKFHTEIEHIMITGGWDNHLKIWDVRTPDGIQRTISGPHLCGDGLDIKGHQVLTGSWVQHNALQVWDYGEGQLIQNVPFRQTPGDQGEFLYCAQFCDNNVVMAGGSGTSSVQAINLITNELVGEIKSDKPIQALDTTIGGRMAAMGGSSSDVILSKME